MVSSKHRPGAGVKLLPADEPLVKTLPVSPLASVRRKGPIQTHPPASSDTIAIHLPGRETPVQFNRKPVITLGRGSAADASSPDVDLTSVGGHTLGVSRRHAVIRQIRGTYYIYDAKSTNGTWLNGNRLDPNRLYPFLHGAQLRLGRLVLTIHFPD